MNFVFWALMSFVFLTVLAVLQSFVLALMGIDLNKSFGAPRSIGLAILYYVSGSIISGWLIFVGAHL